MKYENANLHALDGFTKLWYMRKVNNEKGQTAFVIQWNLLMLPLL
jgi:hypothetical protein